MDLLEELADAGLAGVVDYYYSFDHLLDGRGGGVCMLINGEVSGGATAAPAALRFLWMGSRLRCGVPRVAAMRVDGVRVEPARLLESYVR